MTRTISRRGLFAAGATAFSLRALRAQERADAAFPRLKVVDIEEHRIQVPWADFQKYEMMHFYGPSRRVIYVVRTNSGLTGLGEAEDAVNKDTLEKYIGTSPFDWVADETSKALGTAMYDLMGKAAGVPVYKLIGPKYRAFVPCAAWHVSTDPKRMAAAVKHVASLGYTWMKYHLSPFENVIDQMEAMQAVAPKGFKIHHDFTMGGSNDHVVELLQKIEKYPIAGAFEDPMPERDLKGYAELRAKCRLPILYHHSPLGSGFETQHRAADGFILGNSAIGSVMRHAGLFAMLDTPFSWQNTGGTITRAMTLHMQAACKTAYLHFNNDTESWSADVTKERLEPVNGLIRVPEAPGLGVTLDRAELERLKKLQLPAQPKWIIKTRFANGSTMYNIGDTRSPIFMVRPDTRRLATLSYDAPVTTEYWDPDGTPAFRAMMARLEKEGMVLERA
jgi:L-alanine-DL-glutamate epimerase-like enolase superfamily enzyme